MTVFTPLMLTSPPVNNQPTKALLPLQQLPHWHFCCLNISAPCYFMSHILVLVLIHCLSTHHYFPCIWTKKWKLQIGPQLLSKSPTDLNCEISADQKIDSSKPRKVLAKVLLWFYYEFIRTFCTRKFGREWHVTRRGSSWTLISMIILIGQEQPQPHPHSSNIMVIPPPVSINHHQPPQQYHTHTIQSYYSYNRTMFSLIDRPSSVSTQINNHSAPWAIVISVGARCCCFLIYIINRALSCPCPFYLSPHKLWKDI